jgi:hypothetical protein
MRIIERAGDGLQWETVVEEASHRRLSHQMHQTLSLIRRDWQAAVPDDVLGRLSARRSPLVDRLECHVKGRPRAGFGGLFVIWRNWRRLSHAPGRPGFLRYLATTVDVSSPAQFVSFGARRLAVRLFAPWRLPRGTSRKTRLD